MSTSVEAKSARQRDGEIVMEALQNLEGPVTITDVVNHIANRQNVLVSTIKEPVKSVLDRGVQMGFIQKFGGRYCTSNIPIDSSEDVPANDKCVHRRPVPSCCRRRLRCVKKSKSSRRRSKSGCRRRRR